MKRPFLRVYLLVAITVLAVSAVWAVGARRELAREVEAQLEVALSPGVQLARDRLRGRRPGPPGADRRGTLAAPPLGQRQHTRLLEALSDAWRVEAQLLAPNTVTLRATDRDRVVRGEVVLARQAATGPLLVAALTDDQWLVLGPLAERPGQRLVAGTLLRVLFALVAIGGVLWLALGPLERRLARLAEAARAIGEGDYSPRLHSDHEDAVGEVARAFDGMATRVARTVEDQRELVAGVSHELRTPLARLMFLLEALEDAADEDERARHLSRAGASVDELNALVNELLTLSRVGATPVTPVATSLAAIVEEAVERTQVPPTLALTVDVRTAREALGDAALLTRAVQNLLANAVRHASSAVVVRVREVGDRLELAVEDDGPGIPATERSRVFEPFTQLDASRGARGEAGLGLAIVRRSATAMGGTVRAEDSPLGGARLVISLAQAR